MRIDLHTHSRASDGTDTPAELVRAAVAAGLDVVAITDHDTADGWAEAAEAAERVGIELVPGMEISTGHRGRGVHLLAYLADPTYPPLAAELDRVLRGRAARVPTMVARLNGLGIDITEDDVRAAAHGAAASGRPHVADALVTLGVVPDRTAAFDRYLGLGRPAHVDRYAAPLEVAIRAVAERRRRVGDRAPVGPRRPGRPGRGDLRARCKRGRPDRPRGRPPGPRRRRPRPATRDRPRTSTWSSPGRATTTGPGKTDHDLGCNTTAPEEYERRSTSARATGTSGAPRSG